VSALPASGPAWEQMRSDADRDLLSIDVGSQTDKSDSYMMAAGLVHQKLFQLGDPAAEEYRSRVQEACLAAMGTERSAENALGPCRQVAGVVIAANLIGWDDAAAEARFSEWVDEIRYAVFPDGRSITSVHEKRPNNWGTHAGASRLACALYVGDDATALRCAQVLEGWLGNRSAYSGFDWGDLSWQADERNPVGINPAGAVKEGYNVDGVLPDDQRRAGSFPGSWTKKSNYVYEAMQGIITQAVILDLHGREEVWQWSGRAILRVYHWLQDVHQQPITDEVNGSDDHWQGYLINHIYGTSFPEPRTTNAGKAAGYTDWTSLNPNWP
jgi:hypothetical protein